MLLENIGGQRLPSSILTLQPLCIYIYSYIRPCRAPTQNLIKHVKYCQMHSYLGFPSSRAKICCPGQGRATCGCLLTTSTWNTSHYLASPATSLNIAVVGKNVVKFRCLQNLCNILLYVWGYFITGLLTEFLY